jgi:proliferating cell nuclear antigen
MRLTITDKIKKDIFVTIFLCLKSFTNSVHIVFKPTHVYLQGMDKAHVCLYDIKVAAEWFTQYEFTDGGLELGGDAPAISINTATIHNVLSISQNNQTLVMHYQGDPEKLNIDFINDLQLKGEFSRFFEIPLVELDLQLLEIPTVEYDAEFTVSAKKMHEITSQLSLFGENMNIFCSEEMINISATGDAGKMMINIPIDDLNEFSISEGQEYKLNYSLNYVHKMCITTKLSQDISLSISESFPMKIAYDIGDGSSAVFYLAPKIVDDE